MAMPTASDWTLAELHRLPDDGNKYELVHGQLFVTPAPTQEHEIVAARLSRVLSRYVEEHGLGIVFHPRAVVRFEGSEVEPDLMVRSAEITARWEDAPTPMLIVEIVSPTTRRRDYGDKRDFYREVGVADYWIVEARIRSVRVVCPDTDEISTSKTLMWKPKPDIPGLTIDLDEIFAGLRPAEE
jgi:Uma2 family endonuclease